MKILIFTLFLSLQFLSVNAKINCSKNTACIETKKDGKFIHFYAINKKDHKMSMHITVDKKNMDSSIALPMQCVLTPKEKRFIFSLEHSQKSWNYNYHYAWTRGDYNAIHDSTYNYNLPYAKGSSYKISQSCNGTFTHKGYSQYAIDFSMPMDTAIHAAREGKVVDVKFNSSKGGNSKSYIDDANYVIIEHDDGTLGEYFHLNYNRVAVKINQFVKKGELLGYSGNTGYTRGPHLHFVVKSANKKGKGISYPTHFSTQKGVITCPKKGTCLTY